MNITTEQATKLLPIFRRAVAAQQSCWDEMREIERVLGRDVDDLSSAVDYAATGGDPDAMTGPQLIDLFSEVVCGENSGRGE